MLHLNVAQKLNAMLLPAIVPYLEPVEYNPYPPIPIL
jgi:hypothetical protein